MAHCCTGVHAGNNCSHASRICSRPLFWNMTNTIPKGSKLARHNHARLRKRTDWAVVAEGQNCIGLSTAADQFPAYDRLQGALHAPLFEPAFTHMLATTKRISRPFHPLHLGSHKEAKRQHPTATVQDKLVYLWSKPAFPKGAPGKLEAHAWSHG